VPGKEGLVGIRGGPRTLKDRVVVVTGASRGIGRDIAVRAADGANVALLAKTDIANPKITGTLTETADAVRAAGGRSLSLVCDVRDSASVQGAIKAVAEAFGGIDIVVNNAPAPWTCEPPRSCRRRPSTGSWPST
jgi:citronellol/citronellal dehydrogenase